MSIRPSARCKATSTWERKTLEHKAYLSDKSMDALYCFYKWLTLMSTPDEIKGFHAEEIGIHDFYTKKHKTTQAQS